MTLLEIQKNIDAGRKVHGDLAPLLTGASMSNAAGVLLMQSKKFSCDAAAFNKETATIAGAGVLMFMLQTLSAMGVTLEDIVREAMKG